MQAEKKYILQNPALLYICYADGNLREHILSFELTGYSIDQVETEKLVHLSTLLKVLLILLLSILLYCETDFSIYHGIKFFRTLYNASMIFHDFFNFVNAWSRFLKHANMHCQYIFLIYLFKITVM